MAISRGYPRFIAVLRHPNYRLYWLGTLFATAGNMAQSLATGWLMVELTDSALWLGLLGFSRTAPLLVFSLFGGIAADRLGKRRTVLVAQIGNAALATLLAAITFAGLVQPWQIVGVALLGGIAWAFSAPSYMALLYDVVAEDELLNTVALNSAMMSVTGIVAPTVAGALVGAIGISGVLGTVPLAFLGIIVVLLLMKGLPPATPTAQAPWRDLLDVFRYIRSDRTVAGLILLETIPGMFALPYFTVLPIFARDVLDVGAQGLGLLMSADSAGSLFGSLALAVIGNAQRKGWLMLGGISGFGFFLIVFAISTFFPLSLAMLVCAGAADEIYISTINALLLSMSPDALRGRVMSVFTLADIGVSPIGNIQIGAVASLVGAQIALAACGAVVVSLVAGVALRAPRLRRLA